MAIQRPTLAHGITIDPAILGGKPTIAGTRVSVELVLEYLANTPDFDQFFLDYPEVTMTDVRAALAYARALVERQPVRARASRIG